MTDRLTEKELAARLGYSVRTVQKWRRERRGIAYIKQEGGVRYLLTDIEAWERARRVEPQGGNMSQENNKIAVHLINGPMNGGVLYLSDPKATLAFTLNGQTGRYVVAPNTEHPTQQFYDDGQFVVSKWQPAEA